MGVDLEKSRRCVAMEEDIGAEELGMGYEQTD